ncbi:MAG: hypothetical protein JRG70_12295, partial [Deltaproteobacteria bacterium]|nr:hypothetical protein [Deltaproteobacteria bacterium]
MKRSVFFSTFLFAAVLSPIVLQSSTCAPTGTASLVVLELRLGSFEGDNTIEGFSSNAYSYDARFPESESVGVLWVRADHPSTSIEVQYDGEPVQLVGLSVAELDVPLGSSELTIHVATRGPTPNSKTYLVRIERVPVFPCTEQGIREAIARGEGPIYFDCDGPTTVATEAEIVINNDVILDGEGNLIVDGGSAAPLAPSEVAPKVNGAHRVFSIPEGVTAELIGFTVTGGATDGDGGGILNAGAFTLTSSTVTANTANRGGGIHNLETGNLTVSNSTLAQNTVESFGGGIRSTGVAELVDSIVSNNIAMIAGGGIATFRTGAMTIVGCAITDNVATRQGGIGNLGDLTVSDTTVSGNTALDEDGGGIANFDGATATLFNTTVSLNRAGRHGGGIENRLGGTLVLVETTVEGNSTSEDGGGIWNRGTLTLTNSTVTTNNAVRGGGVRNDETGTLVIAGSDISENVATTWGGGIHSSGQMEVLDSAVSRNEAGNGAGGIDNWPAEAIMTLTRTIVAENNAAQNGGGIVNNGIATLNEATIADNAAVGEAGGVKNNGTGQFTMINGTVSDNAADAGGGIENAGVLSLIQSTIWGNSAGLDGGGLRNTETGMLLVTGSSVSGNSAGTWGGGIRNTGVTQVAETTVSNNGSAGGPAGISNGPAGIMTIDGSTVHGNATPGNTGGIGNFQGTITVTNTTVSGNESAGTRGGITNGQSGSMTLVNTTVSGNIAADGATGVWNFASLSVRNTIIDGGCGAAPLTLPIDSLGGNIESEGNTCGLGQPTDQVSVPAPLLLLGPLSDNGGPTMTHALLPGSVAIDRVPEPDCVDADGFPLLTDQRGVPRPQGPACDSGAFELGGVPQPDGQCVNDADRAIYEALEYINDDGEPSTCIDAAAEIVADCIFGSVNSEPPLEGCADEARSVIACFPSCADEARSVIACFPTCPPETIHVFAVCAADCTADATGLSAGCAGCYGADVACSTVFCIPVCVADANAPACIQCRIDNGCIPDFNTCSGLPGDI